jgi:hypothetical protein
VRLRSSAATHDSPRREEVTSIDRAIPAAVATAAAGPQSQNRFRYRALAWAIAAALVVVHACNLARLAVDWPLHDDYVQILAVPGYMAALPEWQDRLALLFSLQNEHRIATLRLAGWLGAMLPNGLDFRLLIIVGNLLCLLAAAFALRAYPAWLRAFAAVVCALLLTSMTHHEAQYWATGALAHFGVASYAILTLYALAARWPMPVAFLSACLAAFTTANGLLVFAAAAVLLALSGRRRAALLWLAVGAALVAFYFIGYQPSGEGSGLSALVRQPLKVAAFALAAAGSIGEAFAVSVAIGASLALAWTALIATGAWRRVPPWIAASTLFFMSTAAAIAVGRVGFGAEAVTLSRYRVYSAFAIVFTLAAVLPLAGARGRRAIAVIAIGVFTLLFARAWSSVMPFAVELAMFQAGARDHFLAEGRTFFHDFPPPEFGNFTLYRARVLGVFDPGKGSDPVQTFVGATPPSGNGAVLDQRYVRRGTQVITVGGRLRGSHRAVELWLDDGARAFRAALASLRFHAGLLEAGTGFHGTARLAGLPPGRYRIGVAAGGGVQWTEERIEIR